MCFRIFPTIHFSTPILINCYIQTVKVNCAFISMCMQSPNPQLLLTKNKTVLDTTARISCALPLNELQPWLHCTKAEGSVFHGQCGEIIQRIRTIHVLPLLPELFIRRPIGIGLCTVIVIVGFHFLRHFALPCYQYKEQIWKNNTIKMPKNI